MVRDLNPRPPEYKAGVNRKTVGKPERKTAFGRVRRRSDDNIKVDFTELNRENVGWIHLRKKGVY